MKFAIITFLQIFFEIAFSTPNKDFCGNIFETQVDRVLSGQALSTIIVSHDFECQLQCVGSDNNSCKSFNVRPGNNTKNRICELNNSTRQLKPSCYKRKKGSIYYGSIQISCIDISLRLSGKKKSGLCHSGKLCEKGCSSPLGMESGAISDVQISASFQWDANHAAIQGRLNFQAGGRKQGGWSAKANNQNQWLQADLGSVKKVTHFATQGRNAFSQWVKSYKVEYSDDGSTFHVYKEQGADGDKIFSANSDRDTIVYNFLSSPITTRFVRIHPRTYQGHMSMRMEIYGC